MTFMGKTSLPWVLPTSTAERKEFIPVPQIFPLSSLGQDSGSPRTADITARVRAFASRGLDHDDPTLH